MTIMRERLIILAACGTSVIIAKAIDGVICKAMFGSIDETEIKKTSWVLFRVLCLLHAFVTFLLLGYGTALLTGNDPLFIERIMDYGMRASGLHVIASYGINFILGIGPKSPFDIEFKRKLEEIMEEEQENDNTL